MPSTNDVTEIRVHGVSNTPPENILDIPKGQLVGVPPEPTVSDPTVHLRQTAGDSDTALWRAEPQDPAAHHRIVAYSWGKLTSGRDRAAKDLYRALWMVLLPFAFVNVALWTRPTHSSGTGAPTTQGSENDALPPADRPVRTSGLLAFGVRLFALTSTVTLALTVIGVTLDQVVWQWVPATPELPACNCPADQTAVAAAGVADVSWLRFLDEGWFSFGTRPVAIASGVAALVIVAVWWVAQRSFQYEGEMSQVQGPTEHHDHPLHPMEQKWFWRGNEQVSNLSFLHLAAALSVITVWTAWPTHHALTERTSTAGTWQATLTAWSPVVALLVVGACVLLLFSRAVVERARPRESANDDGLPTSTGFGADHGGVICAAVTGLNLLVLLAVLLLLPPTAWLPVPAGGLPWFDDSILWLAVGQAVLIFLIAAGAFMRRPKTQGGWRVAWGGAGPAVLLTAGWLLGLLYSAVTLFYAADFLNGDGKPFGNDSTIQLPGTLMAASAAVVPYLVFAVLVGLGCVAYVSVRAHRLVDDVLNDYDPGNPNPRSHRRRRARDVARARAIHDFLEGQLLAVLGLLVLVVYVLAWLGIWLTFVQRQESPALRRVDVAPGFLGLSPGTVDALSGLGGRVLLLLALVLALAASQVYRGGPARKLLGVVWDVATFWPRSGHPWAPPCYAERTVPQLVTYIGNRPVGPGFVLAGHSQGSVISAATLWQLPPQHRARCALLTFGTQLRAFYGRAFPAYFGQPLLEDLANSLRPDDASQPRWRSLRRKTDPIGYSVDIMPTVDQPALRDPADLSPPIDDFVDRPIRGHGSYMKDSAFATNANELADELRDE